MKVVHDTQKFVAERAALEILEALKGYEFIAKLHKVVQNDDLATIATSLDVFALVAATAKPSSTSTSLVVFGKESFTWIILKTVAEKRTM